MEESVQSHRSRRMIFPTPRSRDQVMVHRTRFATRKQAGSSIFEYIEVFFDRQRTYSKLGHQRPWQCRL